MTKRFFHFLPALLSLLCLTACSDDENGTVKDAVTETFSLKIDADAASADMTVEFA